MKLSEQQRGAVLVFKPDGPLTDEDAQSFTERLTGASRERLGRVVIDATSIGFVDSAGLESLVDIADGLADGGQSLKLCGVNPTLREVLEVTGVAPRFELFEDANSAVRSFL